MRLLKNHKTDDDITYIEFILIAVVSVVLLLFVWFILSNVWSILFYIIFITGLVTIGKIVYDIVQYMKGNLKS